MFVCSPRRARDEWERAAALQAVLALLASLPDAVCDRGVLLRRLLAQGCAPPAAGCSSPLGHLLQTWLPFGRRAAAFSAWADFLEQCTDLEVWPNPFPQSWNSLPVPGRDVLDVRCISLMWPCVPLLAFC